MVVQFVHLTQLVRDPKLQVVDGAPDAVCSPHSCNSQAETEAKLLMSWQHPHVLRGLANLEICRYLQIFAASFDVYSYWIHLDCTGMQILYVLL